jgi:lysophospholipid acyltransferase (LPLAT)-like uncharacterized protein
MIPYPFSKGIYIWGDPIFVPREAAPEESELKRKELEDALNRITQQADRLFLK